jgi:diacylglycerol kinase (ATP)
MAGAGRTARRWPALGAALRRAGFLHDHAETRAPGEGIRLAREAADAGVPLVVAVGGDGTVNEVVNGLADPEGQPRAALAVLPTGRARDLARTLGLPRDPLAAVERLVRGAERRLDLGVLRSTAGRRLFVNAAGAGFDAAVAERAARLGGTGTIPYLRAVLSSLRDLGATEARLDHDGGPSLAGPLVAAVVGNGAHFGGGMRIAPGADPADGVLDLVTLGDLGRWELLRWLPTVYWGGHLRNPKVRRARVRRLALRAWPPMPVQVDGEPFGETPVEVHVCPGALRLRA